MVDRMLQMSTELEFLAVVDLTNMEASYSVGHSVSMVSSEVTSSSNVKY